MKKKCEKKLKSWKPCSGGFVLWGGNCRSAAQLEGLSLSANRALGPHRKRLQKRSQIRGLQKCIKSTSTSRPLSHHYCTAMHVHNLQVLFINIITINHHHLSYTSKYPAEAGARMNCRHRTPLLGQLTAHLFRFIITRSYAALRAADLDWIVGPGYSSSMNNHEKPTWNHEKP